MTNTKGETRPATGEKRLKYLKPAPADQPAQFNAAIAGAIQACIAGRASEHQQKTAMEWIITAASGTPALHASPTDTAFSLGRAFVGQQIIGIARVNLFKITQHPKE
ncbi:MAG: hypothetical protein WC130_03605 [Kiritimatiellia bacterium]